MSSTIFLKLSESMDLSWKHYFLKWWLLYISTQLPNRNLKLTHASKDEFQPYSQIYPFTVFI